MVKQIITWLRNKVAEYRFWRVKRNLNSDRDFTFCTVQPENPKFFALEILTGKYKGVKFELGEIQYNDGTIDFTTNVVYTPDGVNVKTKSFEKHVSNIMRLIIIESAENAIKVANESRTIDSVEPSEERELYSEDTTVSEERVPERKPRKKTVSGDSGVRPKVQQPAKSKRTRASSRRKGAD